MVDFTTDSIETHVLGRNFQHRECEQFFIEQYSCRRYRDALGITLVGGEVWLFDFGVVVTWGLDKVVCKQFSDDVARFVDSQGDETDLESFTFQLVATETLRMHADRIYLAGDDPLLRLAASHAFAQSAKLSVFEQRAQQVIQANAYIPEALERSGRVPLNRRRLAKLRGALFSTRSDILLNYNLLDTPEFFWEYPDLEPTYVLIARYLDITARVGVLDKKLATIHELFDMLAAEQHHKHAAFLEWIIIVLIAVDIVMYLF